MISTPLKCAPLIKINGKITDEFPYELNEDVEPVYEELKGWKTTLTAVDDKEKFPQALTDYMKFIETRTGVPISIVSVGPDRSQTIKLM